MSQREFGYEVHEMVFSTSRGWVQTDIRWLWNGKGAGGGAIIPSGSCRRETVKRENGDVNRKVTGKSNAHHVTCKPAPGEEYGGEMPRWLQWLPASLQSRSCWCRARSTRWRRSDPLSAGRLTLRPHANVSLFVCQVQTTFRGEVVFQVPGGSSLLSDETFAPKNHQLLPTRWFKQTSDARAE